MRYEELRWDPAAALGRVLTFVGRTADPADLEAIVAANSKERMRAKEASSEFLASQRTDGTPFVRSDRASSWDRDVPTASRARFEAVCGPALAAAGYE
jgi:Sulfotransferase domain